MSPFAHRLHELRMHHGIRQNELAELIGYIGLLTLFARAVV